MHNKQRRQYGFTLIELIVVIAIIGLLVLLVTPKFISYTEEARQAKILNDAKVAEQNMETYLLKNDKLPDDLPVKLISELEKARDESKLYSTSGIVPEDEVFEGEFKVLEGSIKDELITTNLKGIFYGNDKGKIYYEDVKSAKETEPVIIVNDYIKTPTNKDITVTVSADKGKLNQDSYTFTENGEFTFIATYKDMEVTKTVVIDNIDKISPTLELNVNTKEPTTDDIIITIQANDNMGIKEIILPDGSKTISKNTTFIAKENGLYEFKVIDKAGNEVEDSVLIDNLYVKFTEIYRGSSAVYAKDDNNQFYTWGSNNVGQLGLGHTDDIITPTKTDFFGLSAKSILNTSHNTVVLTNNNEVYIWGDNKYGQLGNEELELTLTPIKVNLPDINIKAVRTGVYHLMVLTDEGDVYAWGDNRYGQLGLGHTDNVTIPTKINMGSVKFADISLGDYHSVGLTTTGDVYIWGSNNYSQLETPSEEEPLRVLPKKINIDGKKIKQISARGHHTVVLTTTNEVYIWGYNAGGQLGDGTKINRHEPLKVNIDNKKVKYVNTGSQHTIAITEDDELYIWGYNAGGQIGDGTNEDVLLPTKINVDNKKIKAIDGGSRHTMAITEDGFIYTWGLNDKGQIGDGTTEDRYTPTIIMIKR